MSRVRLVLAAAALAAIGFAWIWLLQRDYFYDARAYWALDYDNLYANSLVGRFGTYLYSPAFAQAMWPLTLLPWQVYAALWSALNLAALIWMARPVLAAVLLFVPFSPVTDEITTGNLHLLLAAALVIGFRYPASYALLLLTKVTPGVAVLWFAGARAWRKLLIALGATAAISAVSFAIGMDQWFDWIGLLRASSGVAVPPDIGVIPGPLWLRTLLAGGLAVVGGLTGWRWTVPAAATLALPVTWSSGLSILVALIPLYRDRLPWLLGGAQSSVPAPSPAAAA
ncbi:MAG TPA: glycosyltransferase family 87 protein [Candidatus Limnocylindria bacterium]|nr:glycosyltransferase family 87 protein [Candidatus Limnocylindria bacterium]